MPAKIDYTGRRIGRVLVLRQIPRKKNNSYWECRCDCERIFPCWSTTFKRGEKFECKVCIADRRRGPDLTGRVFGRWTVVGPSERDVRNKTVYPCKCDCGATGLLAYCTLNHPKKSKSCGCWGRKMKSKWANTTLYPPAHGLSQSAFYRTRIALIHKCYNKKWVSFPKFGGKGISICDLWRNSAKDMYDWAIANGWNEGDVICLKDEEQEFNPTTVYVIGYEEFRSHIALKGGFQITYKGETHSVKKWGEMLSIDPQQLLRKIKASPSVEEAFGSKFRKSQFLRDPTLINTVINMYSDGESILDIAKKLKVTRECIKYQLIKHDIPIKENIFLRRPDIKNDEINMMKNLGMTNVQIGVKLGVSDTSVINRLKRINGIKRDRSKG